MPDAETTTATAPATVPFGQTVRINDIED